MERLIRPTCSKQIFGKLKKKTHGAGNHKSRANLGQGDEQQENFRDIDSVMVLPYFYGLKVCQKCSNYNGIGDFSLSRIDLVVEYTLYKAQMSTMLMIDISHSMILYVR